MSFKRIFSYVLFFVFLAGTTSLFAQKKSNSVFKRANAKMSSVVEKHLSSLKSHPYKFLPRLRAASDGIYTSVNDLRKAYDLNPNDLSFKVTNAQNVIIIIFPLEQPIRANQRLSFDVFRDPEVRSILTTNENITEFKNKAGFVIVKNQLGNFEIQD